MNDEDIQRINELTKTLAQDIDDDAVLEDFTIILALAVADEEGVNEHIVSICSSAKCYVKEGILQEALREHDLGRTSEN